MTWDEFRAEMLAEYPRSLAGAGIALTLMRKAWERCQFEERKRAAGICTRRGAELGGGGPLFAAASEILGSEAGN